MPPIPLPKTSDAGNTLKRTSLNNPLGWQQQVADTVQHATHQSHPQTKAQPPSDTVNEEKKREQVSLIRFSVCVRLMVYL